MPCCSNGPKSRLSIASDISEEGRPLASYLSESWNELRYMQNKKNPETLPRGSVSIELRRSTRGSPLGLGIAGGSDKQYVPIISCLRPGSVAHRSDHLQVGDHLVAVNGIRCTSLKHDEVLTLLKNAGEQVLLDVEYDLNDLCFERPVNAFCKATDITLDKEGGSYGFIMRGGSYGPDAKKCRALTVTAVRPGGPADREGRLRAGDRILSINGIDVFSATLNAANKLLQDAKDSVTLTIEYDVSILESLKNASGPLLLEIDKPPGVSLGADLALDARGPYRRGLYIENIVQGSIADRCGALHVGDEILSIEGVNLELTTLAEAKQLLKGTAQTPNIKVEVIPYSQMEPLGNTTMIDGRKPTVNTRHDSIKKKKEKETDKSSKRRFSRAKSHDRSSTGTVNDNSMSRQHGSVPSLVQQQQYQGRHAPSRSRSHTPFGGGNQWQRPSISSLNASMSGVPCGQVCHSEVMEVVLNSYSRGGFGLILHRQHGFSEVARNPLFVSYIERGSPSEKSGVLQIGDRVLAINDWCTASGTAEEANYIVRHASSPLTLTVEFDVIETVLPSSGVFTVKLAKRGQNLGIVITSNGTGQKGEPVVINDIRTGSVSHRCGSIHSGDRLLAIDNIPVDTCTVEEAVRLLHRSSDIVKLRVKKSSAFVNEDNETAPQTVVYTVEMSRRGGPLGITIASTDERGDPVIISQLAMGGLAERTGALHVGDRILAINGQYLEGKRVSEAMQLLQGANDTVALKISRYIEPCSYGPRRNRNMYDQRYSGQIYHDQYSDHDPNDKVGTPVQSIDSAVESLEDSPIAENHQTNRTSKIYMEQNKYAEELSVHLHRSLATLKSEPTPTHSRNTGEVASSNASSGQPSSEHTCDSGMGSSETGNMTDQFCACSCQQNDTNKNTTSAQDDWMRVLEALETVGESEMLKKLEESIMSGSVPNCDHGSHCRPSGSSLPTHTTPVGSTNRAQLLAPFPITNTILRHPQMATSSNQQTLTNSSLSLTSDGSEAGSGSGRHCGAVPVPPPKPPYPVVSSPNPDQATSLRLSSLLKSFEIIPYITSPQPPNVPSTSAPFLSDGSSTSNSNNTVVSSERQSSSTPVPSVNGEMISGGNIPLEIHRVTLFKDKNYNDFGFSVSDGVQEKGVYINKIRAGGPADLAGNVRPYDRVLQVNDTSLQHLDCNLAVPLLLSSSDKIDILLCRNPNSSTKVILHDSIQEEDETSILSFLKDSAV